MATPTLASTNSPLNPQPYNGKLIDGLVETVEQIEKKPPQPVTQPKPVSEEEKEANAAAILNAARLGDAILRNALGGFPCVNSYRAYYACEG